MTCACKWDGDEVVDACGAHMNLYRRMKAAEARGLVTPNPQHALMLDGMALCYENEASIGPKSRAVYAKINAAACLAGADAIRAQLGDR